MLGGIIAGALSGAAKGIGEVADFKIQQQGKLDYAKAISDMEEEKLLRVDEIKRTRDIDDIGRRTQAEADAKLKAAPMLGQAVAAQTGAQIKAEDDSGVTAALRQRKVDDVKAETNARIDTEIGGTKRMGQDKGYVSALQTLANAKESQASKVQAALGQIQVDNARRVEALRKEFTNPETAVERKTAIREEIQLLTGKDNDNFLPVPLKDESGAITGYQVFDKKQGVFVTPKGSAPVDGKSGPWNNYGKK